MKSAICALLIGSAAAFAPAPVSKTTTSLNAFESELGAQAPLGFFDPLGLLDDADQERFDRLRYVEIKHGRIAQLAFLGNIITRAGVHLSGDIDYSGHSFDSFPNGWAAINGPDAISGSGLAQIVFFVGTLELGVMRTVPMVPHRETSQVISVTVPWTLDGTHSMKKRSYPRGQLSLIMDVRP